MSEPDLILMSVLIFLPLAFAAGLLFFPKGSEEYMRWWSLLGTAVAVEHRYIGPIAEGILADGLVIA